jgi:hypothetical protein
VVGQEYFARTSLLAKTVQPQEDISGFSDEPLENCRDHFDHFHMGDLLRFPAEHPGAEIEGISDEQPERMEG